MLISAIGENLGSRDHAAYSKVYFSSSYLDSVLTLRPYLCPESMSFRVSVNMSVWVIREELSFDMLAAVNRLILGPMAHTVWVL